MQVTLLEPFYTGSHKSWADSLAKYSRHDFQLLTLPGRHWKWRMHGGAISLAEQFLASEQETDLLLATDMLDLTTFLSLTREKTANLPVVLYFHENQFSYPWSQRDPDLVHNRDQHYGFINFTSALAADYCWFNSQYHLDAFIDALKSFKKRAPDYFPKKAIAEIEAKSSVMYLGVDLQKFDQFQTKKQNEQPVILWNHRWEYDKNPKEFLQLLRELKNDHYQFQLIILGEQYSETPKEFVQIAEEFKSEIIYLGYAESFAEYARYLWQADFLPVVSVQDFFGASIVEATYCNTIPILPKRLSYPEILSGHCLSDDILEDLKSLIVEFPNSIQDSYQDQVRKFDWTEQIGKYDNSIDNIYDGF